MSKTPPDSASETDVPPQSRQQWKEYRGNASRCQAAVLLLQLWRNPPKDYMFPRSRTHQLLVTSSTETGWSGSIFICLNSVEIRISLLPLLRIAVRICWPDGAVWGNRFTSRSRHLLYPADLTRIFGDVFLFGIFLDIDNMQNAFCLPGKDMVHGWRKPSIHEDA